MENQKAPIFEYDDRYIASSKYTREDLYKLQEMILEERKNTGEFENPVGYDQNEIDIIVAVLIEKEIKKSK